MPIETMEEQFDKLGFYELEEIEKDFKLNQEIIKVRNNVKQFIRTIRLKDKEELNKLISDEISIAQLEGEKTSRLTSLFNKITEHYN